jgi:hypothetical protein
VSEIGIESEEPTPYTAGYGEDDYSPTRDALIRHLDFSAMMGDPENSLFLEREREEEGEMTREEQELAIRMQMMQFNHSMMSREREEQDEERENSSISTHSTKGFKGNLQKVNVTFQGNKKGKFVSHYLSS